MKAQDNFFSWVNRGLKINEELRQLSTERVEEIRHIISFLQRLHNLENDENKGTLTPKDSKNLKQLKKAMNNYSDLLNQIKT